jgi:hypothetical protein
LFFRGFHSVYFAKHFDSHEQNSKQTGDSWQADVCYCITEALYEIWKDRNKQRHGRDPEQDANKARDEIIAQVQYLYGTQELMNSNYAREIFALPLERRMELSSESIKEWIRQTRPCIQKCIQQWAEKQKKHLHDIREFFTKKQEASKPTRSTNFANGSKSGQRQQLETNKTDPISAQYTTTRTKTRAQQLLTKWFTKKRIIHHDEDDQTIIFESESLLPCSIDRAQRIGL